VLASVEDARGSDLDSWRELCVRVCALSILALLERLGSEVGRNGRRRQGLKRSVLYLCGYSFSLYSTGDMREKFEIKRILYIIFRIICLLWIETAPYRFCFHFPGVCVRRLRRRPHGTGETFIFFFFSPKRIDTYSKCMINLLLVFSRNYWESA
jgi:hypothetical protein